MSGYSNENGRTVDIGAPEIFSQTRTGHLQSSKQEDSAMHTASKVPSLDVKQAEAFLRAGFELFRLHRYNVVYTDLKGRLKPRGKTPLARGWQKEPPLDSSALRRHMADGGNIGIRLGDSHFVIDVDPRNGGRESYERLMKDFPQSDAPTVITGTDGQHIFLRKPDTFEIVGGLPGYPGIDFKKKGGYVVAAGSVHPETERTYHLDPLLDVTDPSQVPMASQALLDFLTTRPRAASTEPMDCSVEQLERFLAALDPSDYSDYSAWLNMAMAAHHATGGSEEGMEVFVAWSQRDPIYVDRDDETRAKWSTFKMTDGKQIRLGTIFHELNNLGRGDLVDEFYRSSAEEDFSGDEPDIGNLPGAHDRDLIDRMNEEYCAVIGASGFEIFKEDTDALYDPPRPVWTSMSRTTFMHWHENTRVKVIGSRRELTQAEFWLQSPRRRQYPGIVLDPDGREPKKLNLWKGWAVTPKAGSWTYLQELTEKVLCAGNSEHAAYVFKWMAFMFQKPGTSPEVAITFRGGEGVGKGTLGRMLLGIAGTHGLTVSSPSQFAGRFNAHLRSVAFLFADEAFVPGNKECEGILKQLLTEPVIAYEGKGANIVAGRNLVHLMMASNNDWITPASVEARRFAVFDVTDERRGDRTFFGKLKQQMERGGGYAAMLHDLLSMDLGDWHPSTEIPKTQALADQKLHSLDPATLFWRSLLERGTLPTTSLIDWAGGAVIIDASSKQEVIDEYDSYLKTGRHYNRRPTAKALVGAGKILGLDTVNKDGKERQWTLPPLHEARRRFEQALGSADLFSY